METNNDITENTPLVEEYEKIMKDVNRAVFSGEWEKEGDNYTKFSLFKTSSYDTFVTTSINPKLL